MVVPFSSQIQLRGVDMELDLIMIGICQMSLMVKSRVK